MLFLSINWIIMPLVLKAWFKLLWASMLWMLEVESISSVPYCTIRSLINLQLPAFDNWRWVCWYSITRDTLMLASKKFQTFKVYKGGKPFFATSVSLHCNIYKVEWNEIILKLAASTRKKMVTISADEYFFVCRACDT